MPHQHHAYKDRTWSVQPEAETLLREILGERLARCPRAVDFEQRLLDGTAVRLRDILDHLTFGDDLTQRRLERAGWVCIQDVWRHSGGYFPEFIRSDGPATCWFRVE